MILLTHRSTVKSLAATAFCSLILLGFGAVTSTHAASTNALAWYESFETLTNGFVLNGSNHLYSAMGGSATASVSTVVSPHGTNSCYVPVGAAFSNVIANSASVVWADMFAKVTLSASPPAADASLSAQFYFDANSNAVVLDGPSTWVTLSKNADNSTAAPVVVGEWTRITVVHNYSKQTWALIVNDELLDDDIAFAGTVANMNSMIVSNDTYLDVILIDTNYPDGTIGSTSNVLLAGDVDSDGMPDYWEIDYFEYADDQDSGDDFDSDGRSSVSEYAKGRTRRTLTAYPSRCHFATALSRHL